MRILIIRMYPYKMNIYNYNCQEIGLAKSLIRKGHICDIVLYTDDIRHEEDFEIERGGKIHIYYLKAKKFLKNAFYGKELNTIIKKYDIIQSAEYDQIANIKLHKELKDKFIIYHGPYQSIYTKGYNIKCKLTDILIHFNKDYLSTKIIAKSDLASDFLRKKGFKNITSVGVGIDTDRLTKKGKSEVYIDNLKKEKKEKNYKYLLYIGKIEDRRNILFLLKIINKISKVDDKIKLIIVGDGDKKYVEKCKNYIRDNKIESNIIYFKSISQDKISNIYECSDLFLLPTSYEIFGMVELEALYYNLPLITTLNGGSTMLLKNNNYGYVVSSLEVDEWINKIYSILSHKFIRDSRKYITNNYTWDAISQKFIDIYIKREDDKR